MYLWLHHGVLYLEPQLVPGHGLLCTSHYDRQPLQVLSVHQQPLLNLVLSYPVSSWLTSQFSRILGVLTAPVSSPSRASDLIPGLSLSFEEESFPYSDQASSS